MAHEDEARLKEQHCDQCARGHAQQGGGYGDAGNGAHQTACKGEDEGARTAECESARGNPILPDSLGSAKGIVP